MPSYEAAREAAVPSGTVRQVRLVAEAVEVEVGPGEVWRTWGYNGQYPGPEIRLRAGERLGATVENSLPEATTIHWHGLPVPNPMDGVPGLTQEPIPSGGSFVYAFAAEPAGSYLYHSHVGLQLDCGLVASLIVEEREPHVAYDREVTLVLDDYLPGPPEPLAEEGEAGGGMMGDDHRTAAMRERMAAMSSDERQQMMQQMHARMMERMEAMPREQRQAIMQRMMAMHQKMMSDPAIRERVMADPEMRRMMEGSMMHEGMDHEKMGTMQHE